ncbi:MAG: phosphodiester glycosidase family protein [Actinomycetes bacterium]
MHKGRGRRRLLVVVLALVALAIVPIISLVGALREPGNLTASERSVEWMRDHNLGPVVNQVEHWWFINHQAKVGGEPDHGLAIGGLPTQQASESDTSSAAASTGLPRIIETPKPVDVSVPDGLTPLPFEGVWQPVGPQVDGSPTMYATQVRPDSVHTSVLDGLVWLDPKLVRFELHPGLKEPGGSFLTPPQVPVDQRLALVAAFNSGFRLKDGNGGVYLEGKTVAPLRPGAASFVILDNGEATVGAWDRDVSMQPNVVSVRQNLVLIVDGGQPVAGLNNNVNGNWGGTVGNTVLVWRSAVCVDANGGIIYGYGNGLGALSLAELMTRAGCERAMELDINPAWTTFNFYVPLVPGDPTSVVGTKLLPDQSKSASRYLSDEARDFFAVFSRLP